MTVCLLNDHDENCVRIYGSDGTHKLSLLPCSVDAQGEVVCVDLCLPDGGVVYCDVPIALVNTLVEYLGLEPIERSATVVRTVSSSCQRLTGNDAQYQLLRDAILVGLGIPVASFNGQNDSQHSLYNSVREMMLSMFGHDTNNEFPEDFKQEYLSKNDA
jgi:hypothetical protein